MTFTQGGGGQRPSSGAMGSTTGGPPVIHGLTEHNATRLRQQAGGGQTTGRPPTPAERLRERSAQASQNISAILAKITQRGEAPEPAKPQILTAQIQQELRSWRTPQIIAIGSSTGGPEALTKLLPHLAPPMPPILIVQHIPAMFSRLLAERLDMACALHICEAATGNDLMPNHVYIAPGGQHMELQQSAEGLRIFCHPGAKVNNVCPSADVLFASVAKYFGSAALGVILTGMGRDGATGLAQMHAQGAHTLGQDEASCVVYGMPRAAFEEQAVDYQVNLQEMAKAITCVVQA